MFNTFNCEESKLISGLIYISRRLQETGTVPDVYHVFKIMYFADKKSLKAHKQPVFGGFCRLPFGPVQDELYQIIKRCKTNKLYRSDFRIHSNHIIEPVSSFDLDEFSETDIDCLDSSIKENASLNFKELCDKSHDTAWDNTATGYQMNLLDIAEASGLNNDEIEYLKEVAQNSILTLDE
jgi:uncharacterized phage-associated protein